MYEKMFACLLAVLAAQQCVYAFPASTPGFTLGQYLPPNPTGKRFEPSGAHFDDATGRLYIAGDAGQFVAMDPFNGALHSNCQLAGDNEGITKALAPNLLYVLDEATSNINEVDENTCLVQRVFQTNLPREIATDSINGGEALAFMPDASMPEGGYFIVGMQTTSTIYEIQLPLVTSQTSTVVTQLGGEKTLNCNGGCPADLAGLVVDSRAGEIIANFDSPQRSIIFDRAYNEKRSYALPDTNTEGVAISHRYCLYFLVRDRVNERKESFDNVVMRYENWEGCDNATQASIEFPSLDPVASEDPQPSADPLCVGVQCEGASVCSCESGACCLPKGAACSQDAECCSNSCGGGRNKSCKGKTVPSAPCQ